MFDWQDLRYFLTLARAGSLSAAARALKVDHATVGRRVASLEAALGYRLVDRLPRSCPLTTQGRALLDMAGPMEDAAQAIERHGRRNALSAFAAVRISAPPAVAARVVAPRVAAFHAKHPRISLDLSGTSGTAALDKGEADIAIRLSRPVEPDLVIRRIGSMRFGLYGTPAQAALPPEARAFIAYDDPLDHVPQQVWLRAHAKDRAIVFRASDLFGQQEAARSGLGLCVLPLFMADPDAGLIRLPIEREPPIRDIWLVTAPSLRRSPVIRAVMNFLAEVVAEACPLAPATE